MPHPWKGLWHGQVKGLLYKALDKNRVNVNAVQPVVGACYR